MAQWLQEFNGADLNKGAPYTGEPFVAFPLHLCYNTPTM